MDTHFHIHWTHTHRLDWECFKTIDEADLRAVELALPGETYQIVELSDSCPQCQELYRRDAD